MFEILINLLRSFSARQLVKNKMAAYSDLHRESRALIDLVISLKVRPYTELTVEEARAQNRHISSSASAAVGKKYQYLGIRTEVLVPAPGSSGQS